MTQRTPTLYLNNCRNLSLRTGKNCHFNVLEEEHWRDAKLTIVRRDSGKAQVIGGFGGCGDEGTRVELMSAGHRYLAHATVGRTFPCTAEGLAAIRAELGTGTVPFSTLD